MNTKQINTDYQQHHPQNNQTQYQYYQIQQPMNQPGPQQQSQQIEIPPQVQQSQPRKLNWTKTLFDYHICLDAQAFQKWDGDLTMNSQDILQKDIPRTRSEDPLMKKQSFRQVLRRITTFYCKQNGITYQQGLLEVVYPFALFRRKEFPTKKCYAYFNAFMRKHFPKVLVQRIVEGKKQLPHAILAITLTQVLLRFHYPILSNCLKQNQIPISLLATQQLLTVFAKNLPTKFVYQIFDYYIQKNNPNYIFYMITALIGKQQKSLLQSAETGTIHKQIQTLKKISSLEDLRKWYKLSQQICRATPESFELISKEFCFSNRNLLTSEDVEKMLRSSEMVGDGYLPIGIGEIDRNVGKYVVVILQKEFITGQKKYQTLKLDFGKLPHAKELSEDKIYVLAAHQKHLEEQTRLLKKFAQKYPNLKYLMLRQKLIDQKRKQCEIF